MSRKREHITLIFYIIFFIYDRLFIPSSAPAATVTLSYKNQWSTLIFPFTRDKQLIILSIIKIRLLLRNKQARKKKWVGLCRKVVGIASGTLAAVPECPILSCFIKLPPSTLNPRQLSV